ncbi:MAG: polysaccharide biosynthesis protein, partial [Bacteroidetes bacterium]
VPLLISVFGKTDYGIWVTVFSIVNWIFTFDLGLGLGLRNKLTDSLTIKDYNRSNSLISTTYFTIIIVAIILFLIELNFDSFLVQ